MMILRCTDLLLAPFSTVPDERETAPPHGVDALGKTRQLGLYRSAMEIAERSAELVGRQNELDLVRSWLTRLEAGPGAVVVTGEPGIGKTTIWTAATAAAQERGALVLVTRPVAAELPLGYAGLGDLFGTVTASVLDDLPDPQAFALSAALSLGPDHGAVDPLLVGRAIVSALRILAGKSAVVLAIDDAQWLDPPSTRALAFAARRLADLPVGLAVTLRGGSDEPLGLASALGDRLVEVAVEGLSLGAMGHLLRSRVDPAISRRILLSVHERSGGNPFYGIQLARAGQGTLPASLKDLVGRSLDLVPPSALPAIELVAVLGPTPVASFDDLVGLDAAVTADVLIEERGDVRFGHPLVAAGAYERIPPGRRRELHRRAADLVSSIEVRARHLALAAAGPEEGRAELLEQAARVAADRGAVETAVELAAHAVRLTPPGDTDARDRRTMDQADYLVLAADEQAAGELVDGLLRGDATGTIRVRALVRRGLMETRPDSAVARLEQAVAEPHDDPALAATTLAQLAWQRGAWLGDLEPAIDEAMTSLELAESIGDDATLVSALTTLGLLLSVAGRAGAANHLRRAIEIIERVPAAAGDHTPRLALAHERWWRGDFAAAAALLDDERGRAEQRGDEGLLLRLNIFGADLATRRGRWDEAERLIDDVLIDARDYWRTLLLTNRAILRGRRGDGAAVADAEAAVSAAGANPTFVAAADFALGLIDLAEGRLARAAERMPRLPELGDRNGARGAEDAVLIPETVAVLVEADRIDQAEELIRQLERRHVQLEPWGTAAEAFCRGLIALAGGDAPAALDLLSAAATGFESLGAPWEQGQALLAQGKALRRVGRRREAASSLERAAAIFTELGAMPARDRAADELRRARPRPRRDDGLTTAESRVAALVATGHTNRETAARLFTTVATVEAHLTRIYSKLGIRSRTELSRLVGGGSVDLEGDALDDGVR
jgi:DNA-binding CsgD family transcriptional regulator